jgi:hypothetical protein
MVCGQGLIDWMILAKEEDKNEHHGALIAAACAKPLAHKASKSFTDA